jgi:hypothetical protein
MFTTNKQNYFPLEYGYVIKYTYSIKVNEQLLEACRNALLCIIIALEACRPPPAARTATCDVRGSSNSSPWRGGVSRSDPVADRSLLIEILHNRRRQLRDGHLGQGQRPEVKPSFNIT